MYDIISFVFLIVRFFASAALSFFYVSRLPEPRYGKRVSFLAWTVLYTAFQVGCYFAFNRILYIENVLALLLDIGLLLLLQRIFFKGDFGRALFAALSIAAGKELLISAIVVLDYHLLSDISQGIAVHLANTDPEGFISYGEALMFISFTLITVIAVGTYVLLLRLYLKLISKGLNRKSRSLAASEVLFLILPSLSSICISITIKMMNTDENMIYYSLYDRYPAAKLWVPLADFLLLGTIIASAVLFGRLMRYNDEKLKRSLLESQIGRMEKEIAEIRDIYSDIRGLKHDMHNHIANISHYVKAVSGAEDKTLADYLGQMQKTVDRLDFSYDTGNPITDIIIRRKAQEAEKQGIAFKSDFTFPQKLGIDAFDLGIILDNALENSMTACEAAEGERIIYLSSYVKGSLMFIETENSFNGKITLDPDTGLPLSSKEDAGEHGLGLSNIRRCAEKYMGDIDVGVTGDRFRLTVMLRGLVERIEKRE